MPKQIVVDTNILAHRDAVRWLSERMGAKYIPVVAYAESARYVLRQGKSLHDHHAYLTQTLGLTVERMDDRHARVAAELAHRDGAEGGWHGNARDYFIAAHVAQSGRVLVTENIRDFTCLGEAAMRFRDAVECI